MIQDFAKELSLGLLHLFYPRLCEGCRQPLHTDETVLCLNCIMELPETNYHDQPDNDSTMRFAGRFPFGYATSYGYFVNDGLLQHLVHRLKYGGRQDIGTFLGTQFGNSLNNVDWIKAIDVIIPVPLHKKRELERGYNQSTLIAQGMSSIVGIPVREEILVRGRRTETQTKKSREDRLKNMAGAFIVQQPDIIRNKHVLLVDDVLTTGATLESCALALLKVEGVKVSIATIGIAV